MPVPLPDKVAQLIDGPNFAHLATIMEDGSPNSATVWIGREGNRLVICTSKDSVKDTNTRRDPRVAISITDTEDPYSEARLRGRVVERQLDSDFKHLDAIARKYTGKSWPYRDEGASVALIIDVEKTHYSKQPFEHKPSAGIKKPA